MNATFNTLKARLIAWYNDHIVAGWYASLAMWVGIFAATFPYLLDLLDAALSNWPQMADALRLTPLQTTITQIFLATVVLPAAKAWRQKWMQKKALVQAAQTGVISSPEKTSAVLIAVPGSAPAVVQAPELP